MPRWRPESRRADPAGDATEISLRDRLEAEFADLSAAAIDDALARAGTPWSAVAGVTVPFDTTEETASQEASARAFLEEVRTRAGAAAARVGLSPALRG